MTSITEVLDRPRLDGSASVFLPGARRSLADSRGSAGRMRPSILHDNEIGTIGGLVQPFRKSIAGLSTCQ